MNAVQSAVAVLGCLGETAAQVTTWFLLAVWFWLVALFVLGDTAVRGRRRGR
jgi:hypothetical protein